MEIDEQLYLDLEAEPVHLAQNQVVLHMGASLEDSRQVVELNGDLLMARAVVQVPAPDSAVIE